jgi:hypothetical protein
MAQAPPTPPLAVMAPSLPPTYVADPVTQPEAKIVETKPIPEHLPG